MARIDGGRQDTSVTNRIFWWSGVPLPSVVDIVRTSRPLLWLNTSILWVLALLVLGQFPTWVDLLFIIYFTLPFNLWLHGINDVYDYESDRLNPRKGSDEGALLPPIYHRTIVACAFLLNLPFWFLAVWKGPLSATLLLVFFILLGWAYSAPPVRAKSRPFLDSLVNIAYIFPYLIALAWHDAPGNIWRASTPAIAAFAVWSVASHAFTSIQDIEADRAGGIRTVATFLGVRDSALFALGFYVAAIVAASYYGQPWPLLVALYPLLVLLYLRLPNRARANLLYRWFILLNSAVGFVVTVYLAVANPANTIWAALVVLSLVGFVLVALVYGRYGERYLKRNQDRVEVDEIE